MSPGYQVVQSSHSIADFAHQHPETFSQWKEESNSIICLSAKSQDDLLKTYYKYKDLTPTAKFFEPDVDEYTSICLYGNPQIRKMLSSMPLIFKNNSNYHEKAI